MEATHGAGLSLSLSAILPLLTSSFHVNHFLASSSYSISSFQEIQPYYHRNSEFVNIIECDHRRNFALSMANEKVDKSSSSVTPNRRKKKNKYANFSKVEKGVVDDSSSGNSKKENQNLDPFEALLAESQEKNKQLRKEKAIRKNKKIDDDLLDEETIEKRKNEKRQRNKILFPDNGSIDPYDPTTYGYVELGTILGPHGVHGLMKVSAVTDFPERLCTPGIRHLKAPNRRSPREIRIVEGRHLLKDEYLVKLDQVGDRNDAMKLRGCVLYSRQEERPKGMGTNEYLITDLVNLEVRLVTGYGDDFDDEVDGHYDESSIDQESDDQEEQNEKTDNEGSEDTLGGKFVGIVAGVVLGEEMCSIPGLGQDLLEIILPRGDRGTPSWKDELILIPFVPEIVPTVDIERDVIYINPPGGLLDLTYIKEEKRRIKGFLPEKSSWKGIDEDASS